MSMAEVIKSIECGAFREIQPQKIGGRNGEYIDCSTLEDEPVIVAGYNADGKCTNEEERKECVEVSRKVLCINE